MALIGKIREKSWLLVAVVGIAMLAFILPEFNLGGGPTEDLYGIGTVDGEKVDETLYQNALNNTRNQIYQTKVQQSQGQQVQFDENDEKRAFSQAWSGMVSEHLMRKEFEKLGLIVDDFELDNILYGEDGFEPSSAISQAPIFQDSATGEFSPNLVRQYFENLETSTDPEAPKQLTSMLDYVRQFRLQEKYNALISKGMHATTVEAKNEYLAQKEVKNVSYVYQSFSKVPEDAVGEISDEEIKAYYDQHNTEKKYEQRAKRKISYFELTVNPSQEDTLKTMEYLNELKPKFAKTTNDSSFVLRFSDVKSFTSSDEGAYFKEGAEVGGTNRYPAAIANEIENAQVGDVVGPFLNKGSLAIAKLIRYADVPFASVRHILINAKTDDEVAKAQRKADSIVRVIRMRNNFEEMVTEFSEDPGSKNSGGKYENFLKGRMVAEFEDFSFNKPVGTLGTVKTNFGIHIIEVLNRTSVKSPVLAVVSKSIDITKPTLDNVNSIGSGMIYDLKDLMANKSLEEKATIFDTFAVNNGYNVRSASVLDNSPSVAGFGTNAEARMLRLAFEDNNEAGTLAGSPIRDKDRFVIAFLAEISEEGIPAFEDVKNRMLTEVKKEKQAQYLFEQMTGKEDLQALANEIGAQYKSEGITFGANNVAVGKEPVLIGAAFSGLADGQRSRPIQGNSGAFVLMVDNTVAAPETADYSAEQAQIKNELQSTLVQRYRQELLKAAEVVDNRKLRTHGIR